MITAVRSIGKLINKRDIKVSKTVNGKIFSIVLSEDYNFVRVEIEDFDITRANRYLYREGASKGNTSVPIAEITEVEKTFKKISNWLLEFKRIISSNTQDSEKLINYETYNIDDSFILTDNDVQTITKIGNVLESSKEEILKLLTQKIEEANIPKKIKKFLTIKLDNGNKFLGDYEIFSNFVIYNEKKKAEKSSSLNNVCSVCGKSKEKVSGKIDVYKFYTIDKPGFIAGGFKEKSAWKNYPVCDECKTYLEEGKKFINFKLSFDFYGLKYYLIPKLMMSKNEEYLAEIIDIFSETTETNNIISLKERIKKRITEDENEILKYLSGKDDFISINFLFLQSQQSAERILLLIEDVLPSRIRKIFEVKERVDLLYGENFNFGKIRTFFKKSDDDKRNSDLDKYFLEVVDSVFKGKKLDFSFLTKFFMQPIRKEFIADSYYLPRIKDAMMCTSFFEKLGLINFEEEEVMEKSIFEEIFAKYGKSLNTSAKRGIFLLGVLTQMLLKKQSKVRGSKPFMKKLKSMKMDEKDIKSLLPEIQNKLEEYDAFDKGKGIIAQEASRYLLEAGENWKMSIDEINFYFACGMNLCDEIAKVVYSKGEGSKDE